jgi:NRPS condensation-like uncharacterized protein
MNNNKWFKLDNAAKIYPAFANKYSTGTFRVAAVMQGQVNPVQLQQALINILDRFPSMTVQMKKGLFWYYFDENENTPKVQIESMLPCSQIHDNDNFLFKVLYFKNRISLECFHALTDGYGAFEFLKTLLYEYIKLNFGSLNKYIGILHPLDVYSEEEVEDSYKRYAVATQKDYHDDKAYKIKGKLIPYEGSFVHHLKLSASKIHQVAKSYNTTITVFLAAVYVQSLIDFNRSNKPVVVTVPVNLRKQFKSKTLRNFTYIVNIAIKQEDYNSFEELIDLIHKQLKEKTTSDFLLSRFSKNVLMEEALWLKLTPSGLKDWVLRFAKAKVHDKCSTTILSNPGIIYMPSDLKKHIKHMEFILYASKAQPINMGVCTFNDEMVISLSRVLVVEQLTT